MNPVEKIAEGLKMIFDGMYDAINDFIKDMRSIFGRIGEPINRIDFFQEAEIRRAKKSKDVRKQKAYVIYHRTKNRRIKKKQLKIMRGY